MEKIKLKNYTGEMVCAVSRYKDNEYLFTDQVEEIKDLEENGYTIHGTVCEKVFDEYFIKNRLKDLFETYAEDNGYEDMEEKLEFDNEKYKKVEEAVREYIKSLGSANDIYYCNEDIIIEVENESME